MTGRAPFEGADLGLLLDKVVRGECRAVRAVNPAAPAALEAVCKKAMAVNTEGRYGSAKEVAEDVERWLADEPVRAYREPVTQMAVRWARKHPGTVAAVAATVLVGLLGLSVGAALLGQKNRQLVELAERESKAKEWAGVRLEQVEKANELLGSIFTALDPRAEEKEDKPLRELLGPKLDQAAAALDGETLGDALTVAASQERLGRAQMGLGHPAKALILFQKAAETREARLGGDHADTLTSRNNLARAYQDTGKLDLALPLFERTLKEREAILGDDHPDTLSSRSNLALRTRA